MGAMLMTASATTSHAATALSGGKTIEIANTLSDPTDLWVSGEDLTRISGFEVKPEGACLGDICIPLRESNTDLVVTRDGAQWINASALARTVHQAVASDAENGVWSFGEVPAIVQSTLGSAKAPDFALKDREGNTVRLSDFRGKKVLLMTWASW